MPRIEPAEFAALDLSSATLVKDFELHDVWRVALEGGADCTVQGLRGLISGTDPHSVGFAVRSLMALRLFLGRIFRLDGRAQEKPTSLLTAAVPADLAQRSQAPPGTPDGSFTLLYMLPREAVYEILNATVHAVLVVAVTPSAGGHHFYWATYIRPVGPITTPYMGLIDPFRRSIVYPGLESWLQRIWLDTVARAGG
ncbi:MAG: DUF2867 domain-containing protein [Gemmatimonadetes bacterium]|jgi:hypothetical protein|nr:DUF2867 domain-containing protein [Gemmatimonadota bacterium]